MFGRETENKITTSLQKLPCDSDNESMITDMDKHSDKHEHAVISKSMHGSGLRVRDEFAKSAGNFEKQK